MPDDAIGDSAGPAVSSDDEAMVSTCAEARTAIADVAVVAQVGGPAEFTTIDLGGGAEPCDQIDGRATFERLE